MSMEILISANCENISLQRAYIFLTHAKIAVIQLFPFVEIIKSIYNSIIRKHNYAVYRAGTIMTSLYNRQGAFPEKLQAAANSIVCLHETSLLRDIFNQTAPPVRPISFAPKRCRASIVECEQCLASRKCQSLGMSLSSFKWG